MFNSSRIASTASTTLPIDPVVKAVDLLLKTKFQPKYAEHTVVNPAYIGRTNQLVIGPRNDRLPFVDLITKNNKSFHLYSAAIELRVDEYVEYEMIEDLMRSRPFLQLPDTAYSPAGVAAVEAMLLAVVQAEDPDRDTRCLPELMSDSAVLERQYSVMSKARLAKTIPLELMIRFVDLGNRKRASYHVRVRHTPDAVHELGRVRYDLMPYEHGVRTMSDLLKMISAPSWQDFLLEIAD
ncbi:hypothetical protein [Pararhizobium sp.]|uniref:hypothetical protein n=1 Tax=Pararhizobium sp. TaxID=1977563 RepID=UPI003D09B6C0